MGRWEPDAAARLERAALSLFAEQGYAATTVPQITARAGLTTRSFFRHFTDKREVLFLRERDFPAVVAGVLADAPPDLTPMELVMFGLEATARNGFPDWRAGMVTRRGVIRSDERLHERELLKGSVLADAIGTALRDHGVPASQADLLAPYAVMLFTAALDQWLDGDGDRTLAEVLRTIQTRLRALVA